MLFLSPRDVLAPRSKALETGGAVRCKPHRHPVPHVAPRMMTECGVPA